MLRRSFLTLTAMGLLAACGSRNQEILPGLRVPLQGAAAAEATAAPSALPAAQVNTAWTHRGGSATHQIGHLALGSNLQSGFVTSIGAGNDRRTRIAAEPVIDGGRIFTMDARARVTALTLQGAEIWRRDVTRAGVSSEAASGGGLAVGGGRLFVTTGFGRLLALSAESGAVLWEQDTDAPGGSSPTVSGNTLYVMGRDGRARAFDAATGLQRWAVIGNGSDAGYIGGAGAAISGDTVVFPFSSSEVMGLFPGGGATRWTNFVAGARPGDAAGAFLTDIAGDPVISGGRVFVGNVSGRIAALNLQNGDELWAVREGAVGRLALVGEALFFVNDQNQLVRRDSRGGALVWRQELPLYQTRRWGGRNTRFVHFGPVIAGGRVIIASSDGMLRQFDATSGALLSEVELASPAATQPIVAQQVLYLVTEDGNLRAFQ
ncbi:PQQ-binding-like beta-propeller repeat protein [Ketogulonicigenium vulgare]|uniref:outer membrane protein assembly factor BamB family protein n=1 Tax=Ketogulonicigenium vulgare TaxID=92945 RepID=UPI002358BFFB|nr:PQQ-binding-like beta-propeller repeat protein [Ketogulonicigenium vulgare]